MKISKYFYIVTLTLNQANQLDVYRSFDYGQTFNVVNPSPVFNFYNDPVVWDGRIEYVLNSNPQFKNLTVTNLNVINGQYYPWDQANISSGILLANASLIQPTNTPNQIQYSWQQLTTPAQQLIPGLSLSQTSGGITMYNNEYINQITISWTPLYTQYNSGNLAISQYRVYDNNFNLLSQGSMTSYIVPLVPNTTIYVSAVNKYGESMKTGISLIVPPNPPIIYDDYNKIKSGLVMGVQYPMLQYTALNYGNVQPDSGKINSGLTIGNVSYPMIFYTVLNYSNVQPDSGKINSGLVMGDYNISGSSTIHYL